VALIYKLLSSESWRQSLTQGHFRGSPVDFKDGFIHFSTSSQVRETAAKHFRGQDNLLIVAVDAKSLGDALKWEPSRGGALFPHLYAPLATSLAVWVKPLPMRPDGTHEFPDLGEE
jgi:uncharacterized protein (DUF952 family)